MKECPKCHKHYDDSMNFCTDCGVALNKVSNQVSVSQSCTSSNRTPETPTVRPRKGGCLKKVIIGTVVFVVAFVGFVHYVNNAATYLRVEPNQLVASKGGGKIKVDVDYDGYVWTINHTPDWIDIDENERKLELFMLGLRMTDGIKYNGEFPERVNPLIEKGLLETENGRLMLTERGTDLANLVFMELKTNHSSLTSSIL